MDLHPVSEKIIAWYLTNKRELPWRETNDPYKIWLSEIILQQTRVAQGLPYYLTFVANYPNVVALAEAPLDEVMRLWQGLGYYSRARNMHETAIYIKEKLNGVFPTKYTELIKLKGLGDYTASAISSFSSKEPRPVLDGNVFRVLSRVFGIHDDIASTRARKLFLEVAGNILDTSRPDLHNQAMMEFGALQCVPKNPSCNTCVILEFCEAQKTKTVDLLPFKSKKNKTKEIDLYFLVVTNGTHYLMRKRKGEENNIWKGLYEFLEVKKEVFSQHLGVQSSFYQTKHVLSHRLLNIQLLEVEVQKLRGVAIDGFEYFTRDEMEKLPKPIVLARYIEAKLKD